MTNIQEQMFSGEQEQYMVEWDFHNAVTDAVNGCMTYGTDYFLAEVKRRLFEIETIMIKPLEIVEA